ncbi:MAG: metal-dependent transcriptional regulator [Spirochaetota bacterium]
MSQGASLETLSETMQMYVKAIHEIQEKKGAARVTDIADRLGVKKGSVSVALRTLAAKELVNYAPYDVITLTDVGREVAEDLDRRYNVLCDFFVSVLGIDPTAADIEACDLEHHISKSLYERLIGFIQYYQSCTPTRFRWNPEIGGFCTDPDEDPPIE